MDKNIKVDDTARDRPAALFLEPLCEPPFEAADVEPEEEEPPPIASPYAFLARSSDTKHESGLKARACSAVAVVISLEHRAMSFSRFV